MTKDQEQRVKEMLNIYKQLKDLGLFTCPNTAKFQEAAKIYIHTGQEQQGRMYIPEAERFLEYRLSPHAHIDSHVCLTKKNR